jgi:hypothetical protein
MNRNEKLNCTQIINFCSVINNIKRRKRQNTESDNIFAKHTSDKNLVSKICKKLLKLNNKNVWIKDLNRHLTKEDIWVAKKKKPKNAPYCILLGNSKLKQQ